MPPSDVLAEELEVLESIYPDELTTHSDDEIEIVVEPDERIHGEDDLRLSMRVKYPASYPDALPIISLEALSGAIDDQERDGLLGDLAASGAESLGMAMTFTLVTHLREKLLDLLRTRAERRRNEELEQERLAIEAEEAQQTRGTPVTVESFVAWKAKFEKETAARKTLEQEAYLKSLPPKERDEMRKVNTRLTGRQLFERDRNLATSDATLVEEGTVSIDISQYDRSEKTDEEEETGINFSDSD